MIYFCAQFHELINGNIKAAKGSARNAINVNISKLINNKSKKRSTIINILFINIPIKIENPTKPCLYSFFQGLKNVLTIRGNEKRLRKYLFK